MGIIYSTNSEYSEEEGDESENLNPEDQLLELHYEKKGRAGKAAIVIKGFIGSTEDLKDLCKLLKSKCAVGGSVKNQEIILQGDVREKATKLLESEGYKTKRIGG
jgi:translation initiation factor 1